MDDKHNLLDAITIIYKKDYDNLKEDRNRLREICEEFVRRVEKGEVRSKRTYDKMREALKLSGEE